MKKIIARSILSVLLCGFLAAESKVDAQAAPVTTLSSTDAATPVSAAPVIKPRLLPGGVSTTATLVAAQAEALPYFGYEIFQGQVQIPTDMGQIEEDYVVGPRDELLIQTWGDYTKQFPVRVAEDGSIDLEGEEQRVFVNGLTLQQVRMEVTRQMSKIHQNLFNWERPAEAKAWVEVRATRVRPILVYVTGEVQKPGTFSMSSSLASLINILTTAGGVKTNGSLRHLRISRSDGRVEDIDLYDFLIRGDTRPVKTRLKYGETIFVDLKRKNCSVKGAIRRPAVYEMLDKESLRDLLEYAGGPAPGAYLKRIQVVRRALNLGTRTLDVDYTNLTDTGTSFPLLDGDVVEIFPSVEEDYIVTLEGAGVYRTGDFQYEAGMTLSDLIERGEGLRSEAFLEKADLVRTREDFAKEFQSFSLKSLYKWNEQTRKMEFIGDKNSPANLRLHRLDKVVIYSAFELAGKDKKIQLDGHVKQPGEHLLAENLKLSNLLFAYGGFEDPDWRKATYQERADLIRTRPDDLSTTIIAIPLRKVLDGDPKADITLQSMDKIVVYSYDEIVKKDKFVTLEGHVKQAGAHPLSENMRISDLLFAYGGFQNRDWRRAAYLERADLIRTRPEDLSTSLIAIPLRKVLDGDPKADITLQSMDKIVVYSYDEIVKKDKFVTLEGHVKQAGAHSLSENMRLLDLLFAYGGFEDKDFRKATYLERADLFRTNPDDLSVNVIPVNLGKVLAGDKESNVLLQSLDRIVVYEYKQFYPDAYFTIDGAVRKPGRYLLAQNTLLSDAITIAGGLLEEAEHKAEVVRRKPDRISPQDPAQIISVDISKDYASEPREKGFELIKDDAVFIRTIPGWGAPRQVRILGEVNYPGEYALAKADERISDLVRRAGSLKDTAYLPGAVFTRHLDGDVTGGGGGASASRWI